MVQLLGYYNPTFYAQEALIQLENALGMASRVHMGFDAERKAFGKGDVIAISRPTSFTAQDAPSTAQDLNPDKIQLTLSNWREVKFKLTDKDLAFTTEKIIADHIRPAAYELANDIDKKLSLLYRSVGNVYDFASTVAGIAAVKKKLFNQKVPLYDQANMHFMVDGGVEEALIQLAAFSQHQGAAGAGVSTQLTGNLGQRYGFNFFTNQNVQTHTTTAFTISGTVAVVGATAKGATSITIDAVTTLTGTAKAGDTFVIAGNTQRYAVTADATAAGNAITVSISPALVADTADNAVVTWDQTDNGKGQNLAFHKNAFALAMAPLSEMGNALGAQIATIQDPKTGLAIRSRVYYVGNSSEVHVALDVLYGVTCLDPNLAIRARQTPA